MSEDTAKPDPAPQKPKSGLTRLGPVIAIIVVAMGIGLMFAARYYKTQNPPVAGTSEKSEKSTKSSVVTIGGPFTLTDHNGQNVTEKTYAGQYKMVFFGYTYCPDVCPTTLTTLSNTLDILGSAAEKVTPLFITVDPARDTVEHLNEYVGYFHPRIVGLTGTDEQIASVAKAYRVYYAKAKPSEDDPLDYLMDHSSITYLIGPDGTFLEHFSHGTEPEKIAERLLEYL